MDNELNVGKEIILEHVRGEMRRRKLDPTLLVFKWVDARKKPLVLHIFRGKQQRSVTFSRTDVKDWTAKPGLYGKYAIRILEAINKLLQEG
jgi:hypothetical protein